MNKLKKKDDLIAWCFLLPGFSGMLIFILIPVVSSLFISFFKWNLIDTPSLIGLDHFGKLLRDPLFLRSLFNTGKYVFSVVPVSIAIALVMAAIMNSGVKLQNVFRTIYFIPHISASVAVAIMWQAIFAGDGLLNSLLNAIHLESIPWLTSVRWAMPSVVILGVWKQIGYFMVVFLAALQGIPESLYEAADMDGATSVQKFFYITIPMLTPAILFILIIAIIASFQVFDITTVLTDGGPAYATNTLVMLIYNTGFIDFKMGYASAQALVLFALVFAITIMQQILAKKWVHYA